MNPPASPAAPPTQPPLDAADPTVNAASALFLRLKTDFPTTVNERWGGGFGGC